MSAVGCFCTPRMTAGLPSKPASPRLIAGAKVTSAICLRRMGCPLFAAIAKLRRSSNREVRPRFLIRYSRPLSSRNPPEVFAEKPRKATSNWSNEIPNSDILDVLGCTWNCRTSPPIGMICATPGIDKSRGRRTQSAYSRTAMGEIFCGSTGIAICMISPMIELIGPMRGNTPAGSPCSMADNRSDTSWRARNMSVSQLKVT